MEIEIRMKAQGPVLARFMRSQARVQVIRGPLGSGKTVQCCQKVLRLMQLQEPNSDGARLSRWYAVRNTYSDLFDTTIKDWRSLWDDLGDFKLGGREPPHQALNFELEDGTKVKSEIVFLALDRPDHVKKLRGVQATGFWMNETKELPKAVFDMADLRHGRYPSPKDGIRPTWHGMIGDTNSFDEDHWLYNLMQAPPDGWEFFHQPGGVVRAGPAQGGRVTWKVNPDAENLVNLPPNYYERGLAGKSDDWVSVNLANEYGFVVAGKPVYPEFRQHLHIVDDPLMPPPGHPVVVGIDFGLTPAATFAWRSAMGHWRVFHELVATDMGAVRFGEILSQELQRVVPMSEVTVWGDPAGDSRAQTDERTPMQILHATGIPAQAAPSNDFIVRREAVAGTLSRIIDGVPGLQVSTRCRMLVKAMAGAYCYRRLKTADERYRDVPDKNEFSHVAEALQYALVGEGENPKLGKYTAHSMKPVVLERDWSPFG